MKRIAIMGIDTVRRKNQLQFDALRELGYNFDILTTDLQGTAKRNLQFDSKSQLIILKKRWLARFFQVFFYLLKHRKQLHHIEIYPGGRFSMIYLCLAKFFSIKSLLVERGDIFRFTKKMDWFNYWLGSLVYKYSNTVWYREPYMKALLEQFGCEKLFFLHNAMKLPEEAVTIPLINKEIDFLWVNRLIPERKIEWLYQAAQAEALQYCKIEVLGLVPAAKEPETQVVQIYALTKKPANVQLHEYNSPFSYYQRAKFFVLPADVVFANFSLLEAMALGIVPIVSKVLGTELLVTDGVNGIVVEHTATGFKEGLQRALQLSVQDYERLAKAAREKIAQQFSFANWRDGLQEIYQTLE